MTIARGKRRMGGGWLLAVTVLSLVLAAVLAEVGLHLFPRLIPAAYRDTFLGHGVEFFRPGALAQTPIEGLPLPLVYDGLDGPPPADLVELGLVPADVDVDRRAYPRIRALVDARGLPNAEALEAADVLFVGDSFTVAAAVREPPGLVSRFEEATGKRAYVLALAGIGPDREAWLLEHVGLGLGPELVLWFFFGGNDVLDARVLLDRREAGVVTYADLEEYRAPPRWILPALLGAALRGRTVDEPREPLPGLLLPRGDGASHRVWFLPRHLLFLTMSRERLAGHRGWPPTVESLRRARDLAAGAGARFALVYLPSKAQVYLPWVERDSALVQRMLTFDGGSVDAAPEDLLAEMLANGGDLEVLVQELCVAEGIPFFSATPFLAAMAARGELGYLTSDTHWSVEGELAVLGPLLAFLRAEGLLKED